MVLILRGLVSSTVYEDFLARTRTSARLHERYRGTLPGGETRSIAHFEPYPLVIVEGHGCRTRDADGNVFVDVLNNYTSLVHGHAFAPVVSAIRAALDDGIVFPAPHPAQAELAEFLVDRYPAIERVRFTNSGTEAASLALRIARAETGRRKIVMVQGGYHGSLAEFADRHPDVRRIPFDDVAAAMAIDDTTAAVVAEPFLGVGGVAPATSSFLGALQQRANEIGAVFVLDEVQSLRNHVHGMHASYGLEPDLVLMGKIIGGGLPVGAVGGRAELLDSTLAGSNAPVNHSGTFNGNVATMRAGIACLAALDESAIARLNQNAGELAARLEQAAAEAGIPAHVTRAGSIMQVHIEPSDADALPSALHIALLLEGVYASPRGMLNLATSLSAADLTQVADAYAAAFGRLRDM